MGLGMPELIVIFVIALILSKVVLVVFFLESTRFIIPLVPGISAVQGAALRELLIAVALLVVLRFYARGLVPERIPQPPLPAAPPAPSAPTN